jgi:hypothetical protein
MKESLLLLFKGKSIDPLHSMAKSRINQQVQGNEFLRLERLLELAVLTTFFFSFSDQTFKYANLKPIF